MMPGPHSSTAAFKGRLLRGRPPMVRSVLVTLALFIFPQLAGVARAYAVDTTVDLGSAGTYSVLAGTAVTNTGPTYIAGDVGVTPATSIVGFPPGTIGGSVHAGDPQAAQALTDLQTAYSDASSRTPNASFAGDLNGQTFYPGVYDTTSALALTGTLTLDGQGNPNAVFIFQVGAALNTAAASDINLINGAQATNVFWQVDGAAGTGAASSFSGTIMAAGAITIGAAATLTGRALSDGTVTLANNNIATPVLSAGGLTIGVPADAGNLGTTVNTVEGEVLSGSLGQVQVTDDRDGPSGSGWVASVTSTAFTSTTGAAIPANDVSYSAGPIVQVGTATYTADNPTGLTGVTPAISATGILGDNSATWNPTITVTIPGGTAPGVYSATITHSVL
jgi:hypothetical protein